MPRLHRGYEGHEPVSRQSSVIFASTPSADARRTPRLAYSTFVFGHAALRPPSRPSVLDPTSSQPQLFSHSPVRSSALVSVSMTLLVAPPETPWPVQASAESE